jgi:hypothetical protein
MNLCLISGKNTVVGQRTNVKLGQLVNVICRPSNSVFGRLHRSDSRFGYPAGAPELQLVLKPPTDVKRQIYW